MNVRNWPIRAKIAALLIVPLLAVGGLLSVLVRGSLNDAHTERDVRDLSRFVTVSADAVDALQRERALTSAAVSSPRREERPTLAATRQRVDAAIAAFGPAARDLAPATHDPDIRTHLAAVQSALVGLRDLRAGVDARSTSADRAEQFFTDAIGALLTADASLDSYASGPDIGARADSLIALGTAKEAFALEGSFIAGALAAGRYQAGDYRRIIQLVGAQETRVTVFRESAELGEDKTYDGLVGGVQPRRAIGLQEELLATGDTRNVLPVDAGTWLTAVADRLDQIRSTEKQLTDGLTAASAQAASRASRSVLTTILIALAVLLLSVALSLLIARSLVRPLRLMRSAALDTAEHRLAEVVHRLRHGEPVEPDPAPIPVLSRDEVGQVAVAFNSVHGVAVRMAMEQAATRKSAGETFLNIARRSQALIHRQLQLIDEMERGATEPRELDELFRLDHLATRMRRHAEDLIVLSGATPARGWSRPVAVRDVARAAMAEVEDYTRIATRTLDDAELVGPVVGDVIHLLAELLENATSFSPPTTWVNVMGQQVANGYAIEIEDAGLGMDEQRRATLNALLSEPVPFDVHTTERLGLFVVARLAQRHGIDVHLRRSPYAGTTAIIRLPKSLLQGGSADVARAAAAGALPGPPGPRPGSPPGSPPGPPSNGIGEPAWRAEPAGRGEAPGTALHAVATAAPIDRPPPSLRQLVGGDQPGDWFSGGDRGPGGPTSGAPSGAPPAITTEPPPAQPAPPTPPAPPPPVRVATLLARSTRPGSAPPPTSAVGRPASGPPESFPGPAPHTGMESAAAAAGVARPMHPPAAAGPTAPPGGVGSSPVPAFTENGLPRRTRQANLGPDAPAGPGPRHGPAHLLSMRSPEETRALMASYQIGSDRGRQVAAEGTGGAPTGGAADAGEGAGGGPPAGGPPHGGPPHGSPPHGGPPHGSPPRGGPPGGDSAGFGEAPR